jgi:hypothetical protein
MFQFPGLPSLRNRTVMLPTSGRVTPFGNVRIKALLPAPRTLSQAYTSFFGIASQGIHHVLVTYPSPKMTSNFYSRAFQHASKPLINKSADEFTSTYYSHFESCSLNNNSIAIHFSCFQSHKKCILPSYFWRIPNNMKTLNFKNHSNC